MKYLTGQSVYLALSGMESIVISQLTARYCHFGSLAGWLLVVGKSCLSRVCPHTRGARRAINRSAQRTRDAQYLGFITRATIC